MLWESRSVQVCWQRKFCQQVNFLFPEQRKIKHTAECPPVINPRCVSLGQHQHYWWELSGVRGRSQFLSKPFQPLPTWRRHIYSKRCCLGMNCESVRLPKTVCITRWLTVLSNDWVDIQNTDSDVSDGKGIGNQFTNARSTCSEEEEGYINMPIE